MNYRDNLAYSFETFEERENKASIKLLKKKKPKNAAIVAKFAVYAVIFVAMLSMLVYSQMTKTQVSQQLEAAKTELSVIEGENAILEVKLNSKLSRNNIEKAALEYGLEKPSDSQYEYIETKGECKAEVIKTPSFFDNVKTWIANLFN